MEETAERREKMERDKEQRLEAFEIMLKAVQNQYADITDKMERLKNQGKVKSVTYHQLMGNRMMYQNMLSLYQIYGLLS